MKDKRIEAVNIRLNVAELDFVKTRAEAIGMTISEYIRGEIIKMKISSEAQEERSTPEANPATVTIIEIRRISLRNVFAGA